MENKFKKAIVTWGTYDTGKTTSLIKVWDKLYERKDWEKIYHIKTIVDDFFAIIKYEGCTILIYSQGDPSKHRGKMAEMKENYPESTWMYKNYFDSIADYLNIEIPHSKEEKKKIEIAFRSKIDIAIGACHITGETVWFWEGRVPNQDEDITWFDSSEYLADKNNEKEINRQSNKRADDIIKELEELCNQLGQ